ncbi:MAG TPA: hypothetical protein V6D02_04880 [Candidatus Obscuribacterales bacterium]
MTFRPSPQPLLLCVALFAALSGVGCNQPDDIAIEQGEVFTYECNEGAMLTVRLNEGMAIADLPDQPNIVLLPIESEFGEKYTDGTTTLQTKGQVATVEVKGQAGLANCQVATAAAAPQDALAELVAVDDLTYSERCEVFSAGGDEVVADGPCHFSQLRQFIYIAREDGVTYELRPTDQPGVYLDANESEVYRQSGLGDRGQIYKMATETVYVYWDGAEAIAPRAVTTISTTLNPTAVTRYTPQTAATVLEDGTIALQIADDDFAFDGVLTAGDDGFSGTVDAVTVSLNPADGSITVLDTATDETLYEYAIGPVEVEAAPAAGE